MMGGACLEFRDRSPKFKNESTHCTATGESIVFLVFHTHLSYSLGMHDRIRRDIDQAIEGMSHSEKLELIDELTQSLRAARNGENPKLATAQKEHLLESVRRISGLPMQGPGGFSGRDHDKVLYAPAGKRPHG